METRAVNEERAWTLDRAYGRGTEIALPAGKRPVRRPARLKQGGEMNSDLDLDEFTARLEASDPGTQPTRKNSEIAIHLSRGEEGWISRQTRA